jgi:hypothetical protein
MEYQVYTKYYLKNKKFAGSLEKRYGFTRELNDQLQKLGKGGKLRSYATSKQAANIGFGLGQNRWLG